MQANKNNRRLHHGAQNYNHIGLNPNRRINLHFGTPQTYQTYHDIDVK